MFDTVEEFDTMHGQGLLLAIHRNRVSDAYIVFLFDDYSAIRERLKTAMQTLVFVKAPTSGKALVVSDGG